MVTSSTFWRVCIFILVTELCERFTYYSITGSLPPEIVSLSSLEYLSLPSTRITGSLPPELFSLGNLETLSLAATSITGSIPGSARRATIERT